MNSRGQPRRFAFDERPITGLDAFDWHKVRHRHGNFLEVWTRKDGRRARHHVQEDGTLREVSATTIRRVITGIIRATVTKMNGETFPIQVDECDLGNGTVVRSK